MPKNIIYDFKIIAYANLIIGALHWQGWGIWIRKAPDPDLDQKGS